MRRLAKGRRFGNLLPFWRSKRKTQEIVTYRQPPRKRFADDARNFVEKCNGGFANNVVQMQMFFDKKGQKGEKNDGKRKKHDNRPY